jgi:hypothetical protein
VGNVLHGKKISLDSLAINQNFKLLAKGIVIPTQEVYNEECSKYFGGKMNIRSRI